MSVFNLRRLGTINDVMKICQDINDSIYDDKITVDISNLTFAKPFATAFFARELKYIASVRKEHDLATFIQGHSAESMAISYLKFIGFFDLIGLHGIGEPMRTKITPHCSYIPITRYLYKRFEPDINIDPMGQPVDLIDPEAKEISRLFTIDSQPHKIIQYIVCEIMRNAYEHSKTDYIYVWGQYWRTGTIELAILDNGIGILSTLKRKYPNLSNEEDAIKKSLVAGVSCADFDIAKNKYGNSGFGLYVISELAKKYGSFFIASKNCAIQFLHGQRFIYNTSPAGTLICIRIDNISSRDYEREIDGIISTGRVTAAQGEYPISPSKQTLSYKK